MSRQFPESVEEKAARLAARAGLLAARASLAGAKEASLESDGPALPTADQLAVRMAERLRQVGATPAEAAAQATMAAQEGRAAAIGLARGDRRLDDLSPAMVANVEAVISIVGRPAWHVRGRRPDTSGATDDDAVWIGLLGPLREQIKSACGRVGCIFRQEADTRTAIGTGWLIAPELLVTNAHVAFLLYKRKFNPQPGDPSDGWRHDTSYDGGIVDFAFENGGTTSQRIPLGLPVYIEEDPDRRPDLAIIRLAEASCRPSPPEPVAIDVSDVAATQWDERPIVAIGHPIADLAGDPKVSLVFGAIDGTKRFSPGKLLRRLGATSLAHDCSTTNGSSGCPILDLASFKAVGLHYWGEPGERNEAVLLPAILDHPALAKSLAGGWGT